jgi:ATPase subunit of ABC transporter with duplicated ATPase domains
VIVSHDRGFLNRTTQVTMWMFRKKLYYYGGNYDTFVKVRGEQMRHRLAMQDHQERRKAQLVQFISRHV